MMKDIRKTITVFSVSALTALFGHAHQKSDENTNPLDTLIDTGQDTPYFLWRIDKDDNGFITREELNKSSKDQGYNTIERLAIWSLTEGYDYIESHYKDVDIRIADGLSTDKIERYLVDISNYQKAETMLDSVAGLSNVLMPSGVNSIKSDAVNQKYFADCGLISVISSLAHTRPMDLYEMFTENEDGTVDITLPSKEPIQAVPSFETLLTGAWANDGSYWPLALELAIIQMVNSDSSAVRRKLHHSLSLITNRIYLTPEMRPDSLSKERQMDINYALSEISAESAIFILTGSPSKTWRLYMSTHADINEKLLELVRSKKVAVAELYSTHHKFPCATMLNSPLIPIDLCSKKLPRHYQVLPSFHYYSILNYDEQSESVTLRNPWGMGEPYDYETLKTVDGRDDGIFEMSLESFMQVFDLLAFEL